MSLDQTASNSPSLALNKRLAFGVDPFRRRFYNLRQARYDAVSDDISRWAVAGGEERKLALLDVGCGWGVRLRHLQAKPNFDRLAISAAVIVDNATHDRDLYKRF